MIINWLNISKPLVLWKSLKYHNGGGGISDIYIEKK